MYTLKVLDIQSCQNPGHSFRKTGNVSNERTLFPVLMIGPPIIQSSFLSVWVCFSSRETY